MGLQRSFTLARRFGAATGMLLHTIACDGASAIEVRFGQQTANARSLISLYGLGPVAPPKDVFREPHVDLGPETGDTLSVSVTGPDAEDVMRRIAELFTADPRSA